MNNSGLYTRGGDKGYTKTLKNNHIPKSDDLINLLGTLDEFSSALGVAKVSGYDKDLNSDIEAIQKKMIEIMGEIAGGKASVTEDCVKVIEGMTDRYSPEGFSDFTIGGENPVSANLNLARTILRRGERIAVKLNMGGRVRAVTLAYLNRLSDLIYAMSEYAKTDRGVKTIEAKSDTISELSLDLAKEISLAVERRAAEMGKKVVVAILDAGANLMLLHAMKDSYIASVRIAQDKAYTSVSLKMPSHVALKESRGGALDGLVPTSSNGLMLLGGGMPLIINGRVVGAIGVSGGTAEEDIAFSEFGAMYLERRLEL